MKVIGPPNLIIILRCFPDMKESTKNQHENATEESLEVSRQNECMAAYGLFLVNFHHEKVAKRSKYDAEGFDVSKPPEVLHPMSIMNVVCYVSPMLDIGLCYAEEKP